MGLRLRGCYPTLVLSGDPGCDENVQGLQQPYSHGRGPLELGADQADSVQPDDAGLVDRAVRTTRVHLRMRREEAKY